MILILCKGYSTVIHISLREHMFLEMKHWYAPSVVASYEKIPSLLKSLSDKKKHDDVIKWKHFPRNWPFVLGILRSPVNSPHNGQRREALMFSLIWAWINGWVNNREAGDFRRNLAHFDVIVMI